ncbi:MAG: PAS domain S-box protein, partial [Myxococcales bacterium]|nr:PAS domain S-box protein [Myxococcales bacterium]
GYSVAELLAMSASETAMLIHPDHREQRIRSGQEEQFADAPPHRFEIRVFRRDGSIYWIDLYATYTTHNGRPAVHFACVDVTERKEAEAAYRTLVDHSLQGIFLLQDDRFVYVNAAFAAMLGHEPEELLVMGPEGLRKLVHPEDSERLARYHSARTAGEEAPPYYESRWIAKDGS